MRVVLLSLAEARAVAEASEWAAKGEHYVPNRIDRAAALRGAEACRRGVRWDRAGRVFFGLSPGCARAIRTALERTRPMWDDGSRGARHVRWFLGRLK